MANFALIGAAGYIAPRHMKAIKETNNKLISAFDPSDNVGVIDSYFPYSSFFTLFEKFEDHLDFLAETGTAVDYVSIASPNHLHASHMRFAMRRGAHAICEKPLVLSDDEIESLRRVEQQSGKRVHTILQLRLHKNVIALKKRVEAELRLDPNKKYQVDLTYLTSRGPWYFNSWKGDIAKSGGIATNIGIHFFDMLSFIFGDLVETKLTAVNDEAAAGILEFGNAEVRWFLSVSDKYLPETAKAEGKRTYRSISVDGDELEFSDGFTDLHTDSYFEILAGRGFGLDEAEPSVRLAQTIRTSTQHGLKGDYHPFAKAMLA